MTIGPVIKRLRAAAGWSQKEFAEELDISASYLSLLESGQREPTIPLLRSMAGKLGIPAAILFAAALDPESSKNPEHAKLLTDVLEKLVDLTTATVAQISIGLNAPE